MESWPLPISRNCWGLCARARLLAPRGQRWVVLGSWWRMGMAICFQFGSTKGFDLANSLWAALSPLGYKIRQCFVPQLSS